MSLSLSSVYGDYACVCAYARACLCLNVHVRNGARRKGVSKRHVYAFRFLVSFDSKLFRVYRLPHVFFSLFFSVCMCVCFIVRFKLFLRCIYLLPAMPMQAFLFLPPVSKPLDELLDRLRTTILFVNSKAALTVHKT